MTIARITRSVFIIMSVVIFAAGYFGGVWTKMINVSDISTESVLLFLVFAFLLFTLFGGRFNDMNLSGWYGLLFLVPILNLVLFVALCIIDGTVGDNKYGKDPNGRIPNDQFIMTEKSVKSVETDDSIEQIDHNLKLLQESLDDEVLDKNEFELKKNKLLSQRNYLVAKNQSESVYNSKKEKLVRLFENGIIDERELNNKLDRLKRELKIGEYNFESINLDAQVYFISNSEEIGPVSVEHVIKLLNTNELNPNSFFRFKNETTYDKRVKDLLK